MKKGFTLVEILIVTLIVAMLGAVVMQTYVTMTRIAFRIQQEKHVTEQSIMLSQVMQNMADSMTIDFARYTAEYGQDYLPNQHGLVQELYLTDGQQQLMMTSVGDCQSHPVLLTGSGCAFALQYDEQAPILLTNTGKASITQVHFKIIPYASSDMYFDNPILCPTTLGSCIYHPGFRLLTQVHAPRIQDTRETSIIIPLQLFFSLQR